MLCSLDGCKKKLTNVELIIKCVCGKSFCSKHRMPECHNCSHDYTKDKVVVEGCKHEKVRKL